MLKYYAKFAEAKKQKKKKSLTGDYFVIKWKATTKKKKKKKHDNIKKKNNIRHLSVYKGFKCPFCTLNCSIKEKNVSNYNYTLNL